MSPKWHKNTNLILKHLSVNVSINDDKLKDQCLVKKSKGKGVCHLVKSKCFTPHFIFDCEQEKVRNEINF